MRGCSVVEMALSGTACEVPVATGEGEREVPEAVATGTDYSTIVFHAPQAGQRPAHLGESAPHSLQNHTDLYLALAITSSDKL